MDIGLRNLDLTLGLSDRALMDFADVALGRCPLARAAVSHPELKNLALLTAPMSLPAGLTADQGARPPLHRPRSLRLYPH